MRSKSHSSIPVSCSGCRTPFLPGKFEATEDEKNKCGKCAMKKAVCAVCGKNVMGLFTACQLCGHGGHVKCIRDWFAGVCGSGQYQFAKNTGCPAGCGCLCQSELYE